MADTKIMPFIAAVVVFYLTVTAVKGQAVDCTALANAGDCDFYTKCVEARFQCGSVDGYPLAYGYRYCRQFKAENDCFTPEGQVWIRNTRICLMQAILNSEVYQSGGTCAEIKAFGIESHVPCYVDNGFCSDMLLKYTNLHCMIFNVFQWTWEFFNKQSIQQVYNAATRCTRQTADSFLSSVDDWMSNSREFVTNEFLQTLKGLFGSCKSGLDIMLVLDASGSIGSANFTTMKNFIANELIPNFNIGRDSSRVGVIRFSTQASIVIKIGSINDATLLQNSIRSISYTGGWTNTSLALKLVLSAFSNTARTSEGIPRVAIVFTDGQSNSPTLTAQAAQSVHDAGIVVYSFGIGNDISVTELNTITSSAAGNVFRIANFSITEFTNMLLPLETLTCTTPAKVSISDKPLKTSLEMNESRLLQYPFPEEEGMTINIDVASGEVLLLGSFSEKHPTTLTADFSAESKDGSGIHMHISPDMYYSNTAGTNTEQREESAGLRRQRRQVDTQQQSAPDATANVSVYLSITGLLSNNSISLNTTHGDTTLGSSAQQYIKALQLKSPYYAPSLVASLFTVIGMTLLLSRTFRSLVQHCLPALAIIIIIWLTYK